MFPPCIPRAKKVKLVVHAVKVSPGVKDDVGGLEGSAEEGGGTLLCSSVWSSDLGMLGPRSLEYFSSGSMSSEEEVLESSSLSRSDSAGTMIVEVLIVETNLSGGDSAGTKDF